jgi:type 2A phosphatase activator TIP41
MMSVAAIAIPQHKLTESPNSRSIEIYDWFITASTNPISNAPECDAIQSLLGIPLPEMIFGNNFLTLEHRPSGVKYSFTAQKGLQNVKKGDLVDGDGAVKVGYADKWLETRQDVSRML